jgi:hypothetical protein
MKAITAIFLSLLIVFTVGCSSGFNVEGSPYTHLDFIRLGARVDDRSCVVAIRSAHAGKSVAALFLSGLLGLIPYLADLHDDSEVAMVAESALVSIPFVDAASSKHHPLQIATYWYGAKLRAEYPVGAAPVGVTLTGPTYGSRIGAAPA